MVVLGKDLADAREEGCLVGLEQVSLVRPEEALHGRPGQMERAIALAVDALPGDLFGGRARARGIGFDARPDTAVGRVARGLDRQPLVAAG